MSPILAFGAALAALIACLLYIVRTLETLLMSDLAVVTAQLTADAQAITNAMHTQQSLIDQQAHQIEALKAAPAGTITPDQLAALEATHQALALLLAPPPGPTAPAISPSA